MANSISKIRRCLQDALLCKVFGHKVFIAEYVNYRNAASSHEQRGLARQRAAP